MIHRIYIAAIIISAFILGAISATVLPQTLNQMETPYNGPTDVISPSDTIKEEDIHVYKNGVAFEIAQGDDTYLVKLDVHDPSWASIANTESMDPVIDSEANTIRVQVPFEEIKVGDIITYQHPTEGKIIHRVVHADNDEFGEYLVLKGDNNPTNDPIKVRADMVLGKVVAIIY